ncbi:hypothetical protein [Nostoc parmelioides]|uniref:Uncharacterized protein n=1 Tax=Nostoc parmelioides FACHB-3921 TaxID=2692909 RepID=A0ABR8BF30_9NOSO|nr:hypothetical protein [Nostoc parmelioides]MBD2252134.1 hypothetical protein [Nostoc parmelioides FACHB-3921]
MNLTEASTDNNAKSLENGGINSTINKQQSRTGVSESNNLDKIREILIGNQMQELDKRFTGLEERIVKELSHVRDETKERLDALEVYIKAEVEVLSESIKNEQLERESHLKAITEEYKFLHTSLEKKLLQFAEQTISNQRNLREQILIQSKNLQDEIRQKYEEINSLIEKETQQLIHDKADRTHLADLFTEIAFRLNK